MKTINNKGYVDPKFLRTMGNQLSHIKQVSYDLMNIQPGHRVLDLGCGPGVDTLNMASMVGCEGEVMGIDYDDNMVSEANNAAINAEVSDWVRHEQSEATQLSFDDNYFDACRSERLFEHLSDPWRALNEMIRVTKPGGMIVVADTDWGSYSTANNELETERKLVRFLAESFLINGYSGRELYGLFNRQQLTDIVINVFPMVSTSLEFSRFGTQAERVEREALKAGVITYDELKRWLADLRISDTVGEYYSSVNMIMIAGRKPL